MAADTLPWGSESLKDEPTPYEKYLEGCARRIDGTLNVVDRLLKPKKVDARVMKISEIEEIIEAYELRAKTHRQAAEHEQYSRPDRASFEDAKAEGFEQAAAILRDWIRGAA